MVAADLLVFVKGKRSMSLQGVCACWRFVVPDLGLMCRSSL
jgi:hypothetical protein